MTDKINTLLERLASLRSDGVEALADELRAIHEGKQLSDDIGALPAAGHVKELKQLAYEGLRVEIESAQDRFRLMRRVAQLGTKRLEEQVRARIPASVLQLKRTVQSNEPIRFSFVLRNDGTLSQRIVLPAIDVRSAQLSTKSALDTDYVVNGARIQVLAVGGAPKYIDVPAGEWVPVDVSFALAATRPNGTYFATAKFLSRPPVELWLEIEAKAS